MISRIRPTNHSGRLDAFVRTSSKLVVFSRGHLDLQYWRKTNNADHLCHMSLAKIGDNAIRGPEMSHTAGQHGHDQTPSQLRV